MDFGRLVVSCYLTMEPNEARAQGEEKGSLGKSQVPGSTILARQKVASLHDGWNSLNLGQYTMYYTMYLYGRLQIDGRGTKLYM